MMMKSHAFVVVRKRRCAAYLTAADESGAGDVESQAKEEVGALTLSLR